MIFPRRGTKSHLLRAMGFICFGFGSAFVLLSIGKTPATHLPTLAVFQPQQHWVQMETLEVVTKSWLVGENINYFNKTLTLEGKGVVSRVHGGIGNQLFQYACSYALARDLRRPLYNFVPASGVDRAFKPLEREFALDRFQIPLTNLIDESTRFEKSSVWKVNDSQLLFRTYPTDHTLLEASRDSYCKSEAFWAQYKEEIISMFQLRPEVVEEFPPYVTNLGKEIENTLESVAVHVRRADYKGVWRLPISYQQESIHKISKMIQHRQKTGSTGPVSIPKFFIFSDDIEYCKRVLRKVSKVHDLVFVSPSKNADSQTTSLQDFFLMTKCKHFIIPNSTFGWWAAYLGTHKSKVNGLSSTSNSDGIVFASNNRPGYFKRYKMSKEKSDFYRYVIHGTVLFPKGWIIHQPLS